MINWSRDLLPSIFRPNHQQLDWYLKQNETHDIISVYILALLTCQQPLLVPNIEKLVSSPTSPCTCRIVRWSRNCARTPIENFVNQGKPGFVSTFCHLENWRWLLVRAGSTTSTSSISSIPKLSGFTVSDFSPRAEQGLGGAFAAATPLLCLEFSRKHRWMSHTVLNTERYFVKSVGYIVHISDIFISSRKIIVGYGFGLVDVARRPFATLPLIFPRLALSL